MYKEKSRIGIKEMIIGSIIALFAILIIANFIPVKISFNQNKLNQPENNETMVLCEYGQTTGPNWVIIGDYKGEFSSDKIEFIDVKWSVSGKLPNSSIFIGHNKYALYGKFNGVETIDGCNYRVFEVKRWEILYPIDRFSLRSYITPKRYLNLFDFLDN